MKILMLSAILGQSTEKRMSRLAETPDSLLADALVAQGTDLDVAAPSFGGDWSRYDIVHLNHLTRSCLRALVPAWGPSGRTTVVWTPHTSGWRPFTQRVVRFLMELRADSIVVFTEDQKRALGRHVRRRKVETIASGLAVERFVLTRRSRPAPGEPLDLLFVGQLVEMKRVHLALDLLRRVIDSGQPARLRIISHEDRLRPELDAYAERLGLSEHVHHLGTRTRDEIGPEMAKAHFLVLPAIREALSTVTSEAAISGLPVLLFDVSGSVEQTPDGYERPDVHDVERFHRLALERIADYETVEAAFVANAPVVRGRLSVDRMVAEHRDLYARLMARK